MGAKAIETTTKGDTFGFSSGSDAEQVNTATRTFTVLVDAGSDYITAALDVLPKKGDEHPYHSGCYVQTVDCTAHSSDPHVYNAVVTYGEKPDAEEEESDVEWPWDDPVDISVSSGNERKVEDMAYAYFGTVQAKDVYDEDEAFNPTVTDKISTTPQWAVLNTLYEKPAQLPEQHDTSVDFKISFKREGSDFAAIWPFLRDMHTVNMLPVSIRDFGLPKYTAYLSDVNCTQEIFKHKENPEDEEETEYPYWNVSLTISAKKRTWVTQIQNMSFNKEGYSEKEGHKTREPIIVKDSVTGVPKPVDSQQRINGNADSGDFNKPMDIDSSGFLNTSYHLQNETYVNLYLLKRPADWAELLMLIPGI